MINLKSNLNKYSKYIPILIFILITFSIINLNYKANSIIKSKKSKVINYLKSHYNNTTIEKKILKNKKNKEENYYIIKNKSNNKEKFWAIHKKAKGYIKNIELITIINKEGKIINSHVIKKDRKENFNALYNINQIIKEIINIKENNTYSDSLTGATITYKAIEKSIKSAYTTFKNKILKQENKIIENIKEIKQTEKVVSKVKKEKSLLKVKTKAIKRKRKTKIKSKQLKKPKLKKKTIKNNLKIIIQREENVYKAKKSKQKTERDYLNQLFNQ